MDRERDDTPRPPGESPSSGARSNWPTHKGGLHDPEDESDVRSLSPGERMSMVWQLTLQAWAFKEGLAHEPRLQRDVGRVVRRGS
ncbi:MAG: hypothetical protein IPJ19_14480 [Planctomycetes bacterium]|nr:hypothetical protein [Planctomycetota bacterium]